LTEKDRNEKTFLSECGYLKESEKEILNNNI